MCLRRAERFFARIVPRFTRAIYQPLNDVTERADNEFNVGFRHRFVSSLAAGCVSAFTSIKVVLARCAVDNLLVACHAEAFRDRFFRFELPHSLQK